MRFLSNRSESTSFTWHAMRMRKLTTVSVCCFSTGLVRRASVPGIDWLRPKTYRHKHNTTGVFKHGRVHQDWEKDWWQRSLVSHERFKVSSPCRQLRRSCGISSRPAPSPRTFLSLQRQIRSCPRRRYLDLRLIPAAKIKLINGQRNMEIYNKSHSVSFLVPDLLVFDSLELPFDDNFSQIHC